MTEWKSLRIAALAAAVAVSWRYGLAGSVDSTGDVIKRAMRIERYLRGEA